MGSGCVGSEERSHGQPARNAAEHAEDVDVHADARTETSRELVARQREGDTNEGSANVDWSSW